MKSIFSLVNEKETFETAAIILRDLPASLLSPYFLLITNLLKTSCLMSTRELMRELLIKIVDSWSLDEKKRNFQAIRGFEESGNRNLSTAAHLAHLEVLAGAPIADLQEDLDYLIRMTSCSNSEISYSAAELAFTFFQSEHSFQGIKEIHLEYCKSFNDWGRKSLRQGFRYLALQTISESGWIEPVKHASFLIGCLDSHSRHERSIALNLLRKINADDLPLDLLLQAQCSTLGRVRRQTRVLAKKISSDRLAENLELLLVAQERCNSDYRDLAASLALKIPKEKIIIKRNLLNHYLDSTNLRVGMLAKMVANLNY